MGMKRVRGRPLLNWRSNPPPAATSFEGDGLRPPHRTSGSASTRQPHAGAEGPKQVGDQIGPEATAPAVERQLFTHVGGGRRWPSGPAFRSTIRASRRLEGTDPSVAATQAANDLARVDPHVGP